MTLTDTPTPTLIPLPVVVAEPLLIAWPSILAHDCTVAGPPAFTVIPSGIEAVDDPFSILTATAPATSTDPDDVFAFDELSFEPLPFALEFPTFDSSVLAVLSATFFWFVV